MPSTTRAKTRCAMPGCRAWAKRGEMLCASHLRSAAVQRRSRAVLPLLRAVAAPPALPATGASADEGVAVIDRELQHLLEARRYFRAWVEELRERAARGDSPAEEGGRALNPAQFMHAWNGSTNRVIQLVKARCEVSGAGASKLEALLRDVLNEQADGVLGGPDDVATRAGGSRDGESR